MINWIFQNQGCNTVPVAEAHDRTLIALSSINSFCDGKVSVSLMSKMQVSKRYFFTLLNLS